MNAVQVKHNSTLRAILLLVVAVSPSTDFLLQSVGRLASSGGRDRNEDAVMLATAYHIASGVFGNAIADHLAVERPTVRALLTGSFCLTTSLVAQETAWTRTALAPPPDNFALELTVLPQVWFRARQHAFSLRSHGMPQNTPAELASN